MTWAPLATIAADLGLSVRATLATVDRLYHEGHVDLAYQSTPTGKLYPVEAVRVAVRADMLGHVEVSEVTAPIPKAAARRQAEREARTAHRAQRQVEGKAAKANRRAARAARGRAYY